MNEEYFAIRTVVKGTVKIGGRVYQVDERHLKYDGRLDGQRFAFLRLFQEKENGQGIEYQPFIALWSTEQNFSDLWNTGEGPERIMDGIWVWWEARQ